MFFSKDTTKQRKITTSHSDILYVYALLFLMEYTTCVDFLSRHLCCTLDFMIKVVVLTVIELKQVLKIDEDLAGYIAFGVTDEIEKL
jgi:hypothetical protein